MSRTFHLRTVRVWPLGVLLCAAFFYCYRDVFAFLVAEWSTNDVYSHGFLIPAISLFLVWERREMLRTTPRGAAPWRGLLAVVAGLFLLAGGRRLNVASMQAISMLPVISGLVLVAGGAAILRIVWFPIVYLLAMLPIWDVVTEPLHLPFQQLSADVGAWILGLLGVPVHHQGIHLFLPNVTLEVARVCSGVNYLIAVAAISVPLAYTMFPDNLRRWLLIVGGLVVAIGANPLRVALIGVTSYYRLSENIHGPGHVLQGISVAVLGYAGLFVGGRILASWPRAAAAVPPRAPAPRPSRASGKPLTAMAIMPATSLAAVLLVAGGTIHVSAVTADSVTSELPETLGAWRRVQAYGERGDSPASSGVRHMYRAGSGPAAEVYVRPVLQDAASEVDRRWTEVVGLGGLPMTLALEGDEAVRVNRAVRGEGPERRLVFYWYDVGRSVHAHSTPARFAMLWHRMTGSGRQPALVVVSYPADNSLEQTAAETALSEFARHLIAALRQRETRA
jgi:exosortase